MSNMFSLFRGIKSNIFYRWVPSNITRENYAIFVGLLSYVGHSFRIYSSNIHGLSKVFSKLFVPGKSDSESLFNVPCLTYFSVSFAC